MQVQVLFPARHEIRISRLGGRLVRIFVTFYFSKGIVIYIFHDTI